MHALNRSAQTTGQLFGFRNGTRTNHVQQAAGNDERKLTNTTIESACMVHDINVSENKSLPQ